MKVTLYAGTPYVVVGEVCEGAGFAPGVVGCEGTGDAPSPFTPWAVTIGRWKGEGTGWGMWEDTGWNPWTPAV